MANENERPRAAGRVAAIGGRRAVAWAGALRGDFFPAIRREILSAAHAEAEAARLAPWLPVCFGIGILFYFAAPQEPSFWVAAVTFIFIALIAFISREKPIAFAISLALAAAAAEFLLRIFCKCKSGGPPSKKRVLVLLN